MTATSLESVGPSMPTEPVVDPDLPVIDTHMHLWNGLGFEYFVPEYLADIGDGHRVVSSVHIECGMAYLEDGDPAFRPVGETLFVVDECDRAVSPDHSLAASIIGSVDMELGDGIKPVLEAHLAAGKGRFRGVRGRVAWDADPVAGYPSDSGYPDGNIILDESVLAAGKALSSLGLVLDVWAFHPQIDALAAFAAKVPDLKIILNHLGGPLAVGGYSGRRQEVFADWEARLRNIAALPNVFMKLSGLGVTRLGFGTHGQQAASSDELISECGTYVTTCVDVFGPDRLVFGSNFPVDRAVASYRVLLNTYKTILSGLSYGERLSIFHDNAKHLYDL